ncbi:MAG: sulfatase [Elusimicrobiota bacterium]|jgi:arylsulfatase A-like enzyme
MLMLGKSFTRIGSALLLAASLGAHARAAESEQDFSGRFKDFNVLMISLSNASAQRMSLYGYGRKTTPKLDEWAKKNALVFDNAFTHASWTLPVAVSLFTGLYPYTHGIVRRRTLNKLPASIPTLAEMLKAEGYRTAAFTGGLDYHPAFSHMRGFEDQAKNPNFSGFDSVLPQARDWLKKRGGERFFLFLHGYDVHCPFMPQPPYKGRFSAPYRPSDRLDTQRCVRGAVEGAKVAAHQLISCEESPPGSTGTVSCQPLEEPITLSREDTEYLGALYDEELLELDARIAGFLDSLPPKLLDRTLVIVLSDHGEMFARHGRFGRVGTWRGSNYDDVLHIPLLMRLPGIPGRRIEGLTQTIDLLPTLLDALGLAAPASIQGKSLAPLIARDAPVNRFAYSGVPYIIDERHPLKSFFAYDSFSETLRGERWKLLREVLLVPQARPQQSSDRALPAGEGVPVGLRTTAQRAGLRVPQAGEAAKLSPWKREEHLELYDIQKDPDETRELSAKEPETLARLKAELERWGESARKAGPTRSTQDIPSGVIKRALELGYWE